MATDRYAVIGHGISYSRSPQIHARFAAQCRQSLDYGIIDAPADGFLAAAQAFFDGGGRGLNVTVPFKQEACAFAGTLTPRAHDAGAVNTLAMLADGTLLGDNTDGAGLVRDLRHNLGCALEGARVLLLGAGGAAHGVVLPLLGAGVAGVVIANRTPERALHLAAQFAGRGAVHALGDAGAMQLAAHGPEGFELIANATAASSAGELPGIPDHAIGATTLAYDLGYTQPQTAFMQWARAAGAARTVNGLGMLVEQAAESFLLWRGVRPNTTPVLEALHAAHAASD
jgi:shikimate dehydrogenase